MGDNIEQAIEAFYDTVASPGNWSTALHEFARSTDSVGCLFFSKETESIARDLPASPDVSDFIHEFMSDGWYQIDTTSIRGWPLLRQKSHTFITDNDLTTDEERRSLQYFQDFRFKWTFRHWGAIGFHVDGAEWCLSLLRTEKQGEFDLDSSNRLIRAGPHLARIIKLAKTLSINQGKTQLDLLEAMGTPAMLIDARGRVIAISKSAECLVGRDLRIRSNRIEAADSNSNRALSALIFEATTQPISALPLSLSCATIRRSEGPQLIVKVMPLTPQLGELFCRARVLLTFYDPSQRFTAPSALLIELYKLTNAESALAVRLANGASLSDVANESRITKETARGHLKAIFAKVGVNRQSELITVLHKLP